MRRISATFALALMVVMGCEQIFDSNVFAAMEVPPTVNVSAKSASELRALTDDLVFLNQLKSSPTDLANAQSTLTTVMNSSSATTAEKAQAAQTWITLTAFGTTAGDTAIAAVQKLSSLATGSTSASTISSTISSLFAGQTATQIADTLTVLNTISTTFGTLNGYAAGDTSVFFGTANKGDLAQVGVVAAAAAAAIADEVTAAGSISTLAAKIAAGTTLTSGTALNNLAGNIGGTTTGTYGYVATLVNVF